MVFEWAYSGVNKTVPRNAGADCADFMDPTTRKIETVIVIITALIMTIWGYMNISLESRYDDNTNWKKDTQHSSINVKDPDGGGGGSNYNNQHNNYNIRRNRNNTYYSKNMSTKKALLMLMSLIWGMEIGYKFSSRTVIYLLNPCHVTTAIQVCSVFL